MLEHPEHCDESGRSSAQAADDLWRYGFASARETPVELGHGDIYRLTREQLIGLALDVTRMSLRQTTSRSCRP
jgi:hypothetical protein